MRGITITVERAKLLKTAEERIVELLKYQKERKRLEAAAKQEEKDQKSLRAADFHKGLAYLAAKPKGTYKGKYLTMSMHEVYLTISVVTTDGSRPALAELNKLTFRDRYCSPTQELDRLRRAVKTLRLSSDDKLKLTDHSDWFYLLDL